MKGYEHQLKRCFIPWKQPLRLRQSATVNPVSLKLRSILFCLSSPKRSERAIPLFDYVCVHVRPIAYELDNMSLNYVESHIDELYRV